MDDDEESTGPHVDAPYVDLLMTVVRRLDMRTELLDKRTEWLKDYVEGVSTATKRMAERMESEINRVLDLIKIRLDNIDNDITTMRWTGFGIVICLVMMVLVSWWK